MSFVTTNSAKFSIQCIERQHGNSDRFDSSYSIMIDISSMITFKWQRRKKIESNAKVSEQIFFFWFVLHYFFFLSRGTIILAIQRTPIHQNKIFRFFFFSSWCTPKRGARGNCLIPPYVNSALTIQCKRSN